MRVEHPVHSNNAETNSFQWLPEESVSIPTVKNCRRKQAEGNLSNLLQSDMSMMITEALMNLRLSLNSLI